MEWDDFYSSGIVNEWFKIKSKLPLLSKLSFSQNTICKNRRSSLDAFFDEFVKGYRSCVYINKVLSHMMILYFDTCCVPKVSVDLLQFSGLRSVDPISWRNWYNEYLLL